MTSLAAGFLAGSIYEKILVEAYERSSRHDWSSVLDAVDTAKSIFKDDPSPLSELTVSDPTMTVNQYSMNGMEFVSTAFTNHFGVTTHQFSTLSGGAAIELQMPTVTVSISGPAESPVVSSSTGLDGFDLNQATLINTSSTPISPDGYAQAIALGKSQLGTGYQGNTVDFAMDLGKAAGLPEFGVGTQSPVWDQGPPAIDQSLRITGVPSLLDLDTVAGKYAFNIAYTLGNPLETLLSHDYGVPVAGWIQDAIDKLGASKKAAALKAAAQQYQENGGSPIVIDLDGDGLETISVADSSVIFDITGDGVSEKTGWLGSDDGFLVRDLNANGIIDNVNEMFGGLDRAIGYAELAALDSNFDGKISGDDDAYESLLVWRDVGSDGKSGVGELSTLLVAGLENLDLHYESQDVRQNGNLIGEVSSAVVNGTDVQMADVYFRYVPVATVSSAPESAGVSSSELKLGAVVPIYAQLPVTEFSCSVI